MFLQSSIIGCAVILVCVSFVKNDDVYDFSKPHPHNMSLLGVSFRYMNISWVAPEGNRTNLTHYVINYQRKKLMGENGPFCPNDDMKKININSTDNATDFTFTLKGLDPGTIYRFCIEAVYDSLHRPYSHTIERQTDGCGPIDTAEKQCQCSNMGTEKGNRCEGDTCTCKCKNKTFTGEKCEKCVPGYYLHESIGNCEACSQCPDDRSDGTCQLGNNSSILMCGCKSKYVGRTCSLCADGLFDSAGSCIPCKCNGNDNPHDSVKCNRRTGLCQSCYYNTTGDYCEKCKEGYVGDALKKSCIKNTTDDDEDSTASPAEPPERSLHYRRLHIATVAGVCVGSIGLLVMLISACFIVRWKRLRRRPFNFWTVELRDDHENVNFSQMMDGEENGGDVQFFEKDSQPTGHRNSKSNIYRAVRS